jgi:hypothetical protein
MESEKGPKNGTYTQVPNVFFDTCDLPESAQILYLRLYRHIAYKDDHKFVGSVRKLSNLVRLSKSTVDRMVKVLEESRLITIGYEPSRDIDCKVMAITINPQELWVLNKQHYEEKDISVWNKTLPDAKMLSQIGTLHPDMIEDNANSGQNISDSKSKSAQERDKKNRMKEGRKGNSPNIEDENRMSPSPEDFSPSLTHSPSPSSSISSKSPKKGYLQKPVRDVLRSIGDDQLEQHHFERVHSLWLECDEQDIKVFRERIYDARVQASGKDMEYFYRCLERAVK